MKILDPACGSGAFPMGMFNLMVQTVEKLQEHKTTYKNKLDIIQNCIYGVDIQNIAIEISKLRFFISLLVDCDIPENIADFDVLPNLETKFVVANTLIGIDLTGGDDMFQKNFMAECRNLTQIFTPFTTSRTPTEKSRIKNEFETEKQRLIALLEQNHFVGGEIDKIAAWNPFIVCYCSPFFDSGIMFDMLDGFDIVISNPPYGASTGASDKAYFKKNYQSAKTISGVQKGSLDTYTLFIEKGFNCLKISGNLNFIVPMSVISSDAMTALHRLLLTSCKEIKVASFSERPRQPFSNACQATSILYLQRTNTPCELLLTTKKNRWNKGIELDVLIKNLKFTQGFDNRLSGRIPKVSDEIEQVILKKLFGNDNQAISKFIDNNGKPIYYRMAGGRYFKVVTNYPTHSSAEKSIHLSKKYADCIGLFMSSTFFWWYVQVFADDHNLKFFEIENFKIPVEKLTTDKIDDFNNLYNKYLNDIEDHAGINSRGVKEYKIRKSRLLVDQIDDLICPLYGLSPEETEFIKHYEIEFRLSEDE